MIRLGRKPVDLDLLQAWAAEWAGLFYGLRDGYPGAIGLRMLAGPKDQPIGYIPPDPNPPPGTIALGAKVFAIPENVTVGYTVGNQDMRKVLLPRSLLFRPEHRATMDAFMSALNKSEEKGRFIHLRPVAPAPEVWSAVKRAQRPKEISVALEGMKRWALGIDGLPAIVGLPGRAQPMMSLAKSEEEGRAMVKRALGGGFVPGWTILPFIDLTDWPKKVLQAKRLWTYPRTDRPKSDDKRIEFFAKAFAALSLGKSPATATARWLAGWHWPKDWYTEALQPGMGRMEEWKP